MSALAVRIGELMSLRRTSIDIDPAEWYSPIGVRSFAQGLIRYPSCSGAELSKMRYFELPPNSLVVSNIKAWEGAVALATSGDVGLVASNRFLTYVPTVPDLNLRYVWHYLASDAGTRALAQASPDSADRNRTLSIKAFENLTLPLVPLSEQVSVVARLDGYSEIARLLERQRQIAAALPQAARNEVFSKLI